MATYTINVERDDNETFLITCPDLPEVTTFAESRDEITYRAVQAIEEAIAARLADGREIPQPKGRGQVPVDLPTQTDIKLALWRELAATKVTRAELARRLGRHREQIDRLFRLDHATRMDQFDAAFHAIGRELKVSVADAGKQAGRRQKEH